MHPYQSLTWTLPLPSQMDNWYVYPNMNILVPANTQTVCRLLGGFLHLTCTLSCHQVHTISRKLNQPLTWTSWFFRWHFSCQTNVDTVVQNHENKRRYCQDQRFLDILACWRECNRINDAQTESKVKTSIVKHLAYLTGRTRVLYAQATPTTLLRKRDLCFFSQTKLFWISTQNLPVS